METGFMDRLLLAQTTIDYDVDRRSEEGLIGRLLASDRTRVVIVDNGLVAVPKRFGSVTPAALDCTADPAAPRPDAEAPVGTVRLATVSAVDEPRNAAVGADHELGRSAVTFSQRALRDFDWVELRSFAPCASTHDAGLATSAVAICAWHSQQRFCPACGAPVRPALAGWAQACTNPADADRLLFPRIEPAVITAIVDDEERILLQHNTAWRERFYSVSAGFVEAGESLEHAVRREAHEEVGVELDEVCYLGSQPWPFPASIMLGFRAHARTAEVAVDHEEVAAARWFTREDLARAVASGEVELPGRASIARHMIESWYGGEIG